MILDKEEIDSRLSSPLNLLNRLRALTSSENKIVSISSSIQTESSQSRPGQHPSLPPSVDELVDGIEDKLNTARCKSGAKEVLATAIERLNVKVNDVEDAIQLSRIATDMGKIVNGFDSVKGSSQATAIPIIYRPIMLLETNFQTIQVNE